MPKSFMSKKIFLIILFLLFVVKFNNSRLITYIIIYGSLLIINPMFSQMSLIGNEPFYNADILKESKILTNNWRTFRNEALNSFNTFKDIKGDLFFSDNIIKKSNTWKKLYIKWHSDVDKIALEKCPKSCKIINSLPNVKVAMFSVLKPGARIEPHRGPFKGCLRFHLGLSTPNSDDCFIKVNNIKYSWRDGKGILLDDTYEHWVENNTDKTRIILFCDIVRPMSNVGNSINNFVINNFGHITSREN